MAVTVVDDYTEIFDCDTTNVNRFGLGGVNNSTAVDTDIKVEGTGSLRARVTGTGVGGNGFDTQTADKDLTPDKHIFMWGRSLDPVAATNGWLIRYSSDTNGAADFADISAGSLSTIRYGVNGFFNFCADPLQPAITENGTVPALTAIRSFAILADHQTSSGRDTFFWDQCKFGNGITITGGASAPRGSVEVAAADETAGRGCFKDIAGVYYILGRVTIGDVTASTNSTFEDTAKVWVFEAQNVSASFHVIEFLGGTGTNAATFGTKSGSGATAEGSGGNAFLSAGLVPFRIEAIDSEINVGLFGCTFVNSVALRDDAMRTFQFEDSGTGFTVDTRDANDATATDAPLLPATPAINDAAYFAHKEIFSELKLNIATAKVGTYTITWEYSQGSSTWAALTDVTDGTNGFTTTGTNSLTYSIPADWATDTINSAGPYYWIRARISAFTSTTTTPVLTQGFCVMGGRIRFEQANVDCIRGTFANCDTVVIRNGAFLKKSTITDSVAPAKSAALDLGATDPTADTVRDLVIQNCSKGILLQKTAAGNVTYNFRNIKFSNNTNDVRVDFPSGSTVTINVVDGGDTPTVDNVNGSTIVISNPVTTTINVKDNNGVNLQNARVLLEASDGTGDFPFGESVTITRSGSTATVTHTTHGLETGDIVVIRGADQPEYNGPFVITVTTVNAYTYTVSGTPTTPATGTIVSSGAMINALTNASGDVTGSRTFVLDQPVKGAVRKSTASPRFKSFTLIGTIDNTNGLSINVQMILDE